MKGNPSPKNESHDEEPRSNTEGTLRQAIDLAIEKGKIAAAELEKSIDRTLASLCESTKSLRTWASWKSSSGGKQTPTAVAGRYIALVEAKNREISSVFQQQKKSLETFNIVFFGRTGVGKSSLIDALSYGNGKSVSQGESDWTTEVNTVSWNSCVLVDTPGINGWGRSRPRAEMEEKARLATESADVVMLCFDSQSQQESEFSKVAEWIQKYRKPVIAVLNGRNPHWRMPTRVPVASARKTVSQHIQQNATNIRDELGKIGLLSVPIVAISSKRALFARATEPYEGPDAVTLANHRQEYGCDSLLAWSNLKALEDLLVESLKSDAAAIRTEMLRNKLKGTLKSLDSELENIGLEAQKAVDLVENTIESVFKIVGYPSVDKRAVFKDDRSDDDLLTYLESVRHAQFQSPRIGEFSTFLRHLLSSHFSPLRSDALNKAELVIAKAFDEGRDISSEDFNRSVFALKSMESVAQNVLKDSIEFLRRKIALVGRDAEVDFRCLVDGETSIKGAAGKGYKGVSTALKAGGILSGVASATLGGLALANIWNPVGWVAVATVLGTSILSGLLKWSGNAAQRKAEHRRLEARRSALADAGKSINTMFDRFIEDVNEQALQHAKDGMAQLLVEPLREDISLWLVQKELKKTRKELSDALQALGHHSAPMKVFERAAERVESERFPGDLAAAKKLWLGESWVEDLNGLEAVSGDSSEKRTEAYDPNLYARAKEQIRSFFAQFTEKPKHGSGKGWLMELQAASEGDVDAAPILSELNALLTAGIPRLHLHGDYNSGKSSFIKRLLIDSGLPVPEQLVVRADPTTSKVTSYSWLWLELVDNPGFQSGREDETIAAVSASPDASFILYLFQPNLVTGSDLAIQTVLKGDETTGFISKLDKTFFVINRADELGVDPNEDFNGFMHLCQRKQTELIQAMASHGMDISAERVFCMASDPYGEVGDRRDVNSTHYDSFRAWDGFGALTEAFRHVRSDLVRVGCDISVLEGGAARISRLRTSIKEKLVKFRKEREFLARIKTALNDSISESDQITAHVDGRLLKMIDENAYGLLSDTFKAVDKFEIEALAKQLEKWWEDKALRSDFEQWQNESQKTIDEWAERVQDEIGRRFNSVEFSTTFPDLKEQFESEMLFHKEKRTAAKVYDVLRIPLNLGENRDVVYDVGKFIGMKFRPWGAVKGAIRIGKANVILSVVGVGIDINDLIRSNRNEAERDTVRNNARKFVLKTKEQFHKKIIEDKDGLFAYVQGNRKEMEKHRNALRAEILKQDNESKVMQQRLETYLRLLNSARDYLGLPYIKEENLGA